MYSGAGGPLVTSQTMYVLLLLLNTFPPMNFKTALPVAIFMSSGVPLFNVDAEGPGQLEVTLNHANVKMVVNALGPPPKYVLDQCHERGILVGGLDHGPC